MPKLASRPNMRILSDMEKSIQLNSVTQAERKLQRKICVTNMIPVSQIFRLLKTLTAREIQ
jgi:hypothetical protein